VHLTRGSVALRGATPPVERRGGGLFTNDLYICTLFYFYDSFDASSGSSKGRDTVSAEIFPIYAFNIDLYNNTLKSIKINIG
jgi:hypothetical protein